MRAFIAAKGVLVTTDFFAERKAECVPAVPAFAAQNVGTHDHSVADIEACATVFQGMTGRLTDFGNPPNNLVARNDRKRRVGLRGRSGELHGFTPKMCLSVPQMPHISSSTTSENSSTCG